ncbi:MAG: hypothetical protein IJ387_02115, partial [Thermoguttaceae bacterium]|nr:hypothetical protein [Thermoguttaceae bacterium]
KNALGVEKRTSLDGQNAPDACVARCEKRETQTLRTERIASVERSFKEPFDRGLRARFGLWSPDAEEPGSIPRPAPVEKR